MSHRYNNSCLICNNTDLFQYLDLTDQPLANSYHSGEVLKKYPLQLRLCKRCFHSQLSMSVDPKEMFDHYLYISDTTKTLTSYFKWATDYILEKAPYTNSVLEIACNSGLFLEMFQKRGLICYGVDPAKNIRELSEKRNLKVFVDYWGTEFSNKFKNTVGTMDLIVAVNVLPHVPDPNEFISACVNIISPTGKIFLQSSQCDMFINNEFDVTYHEHASYFVGKSIKQLARNHGLYVSSMIKTDIHSKSFLYSLQKQPCDESQLEQIIEEETRNGIYTIEKYKTFADKAHETKVKLLDGLEKFRKEGYTLIGYGAAAKGNTLLNFMQYKLDYIIDDSYLKWNLLTPGMDIPICSIDLLKEHFEKICFVPLAWNFYKEIKERIVEVRDTKNDIFIRYFPEYQEETHV